MTEGLLAKCSCCHCGTHLEFPIESTGAVAQCPHCGADTELTLDAPPPAADRVSPADVLASFTGTVARARVSFFYRSGLLLVTLVMIMLPVVYLALIAAAGWGVWYYATHFVFLVQSTRGGIYLFLFKCLIYMGPIFAGIVLVFFMIKPLFARRQQGAQPLALNPALEPALFTFIAKVCELTRAPMPRRIDLNCELNAAAAFRRGWRSLLSDDLVLVIGLPLVAGLNAREFAGVIAHEFGHFTQGSAMRMSYIVRRVNGWFARLVYGRDEWDAWLETYGREAEDWRVLLVFNCARLAVGVSRLILKLLLFFAHGVSCFLLRQMEYHADAHEIKLVGSETFERTVRKFALLAEAQHVGYKEMRATWNLSRALPEDLPAYLVAHAAKLPAHIRQRIDDTLGLKRTSLFDTHPSDADRIRRARQAQEPGVFDLDLPASALFSHFDVVSRQVTHLHYTDDLGLSLAAAKLRPTS